MDDGKFWLCFWTIAGTFIILMAIIISANVLTKRYIMVNSGCEEVYDPVARKVLWKKRE